MHCFKLHLCMLFSLDFWTERDVEWSMLMLSWHWRGETISKVKFRLQQHRRFKFSRIQFSDLNEKCRPCVHWFFFFFKLQSEQWVYEQIFLFNLLRLRLRLHQSIRYTKVYILKKGDEFLNKHYNVKNLRNTLHLYF